MHKDFEQLLLHYCVVCTTEGNQNMFFPVKYISDSSPTVIATKHRAFLSHSLLVLNFLYNADYMLSLNFNAKFKWFITDAYYTPVHN